MPRRALLAACFAGLGLAALAAPRPGPAIPPGPAFPSVRAAAAGFVAALGDDARERAVLDFEDPARLDWHYVPRDRAGLPLARMRDAERRAAHELVRALLSERGALEVLGIVELEVELYERARAAGRDPSFRDPDLYYWTVFGDPAGSGPFGLRVEGHHLSLNVTAHADGTVAVAPTFVGADPAHVERGRRAGWRVLAADEDLPRALVRMLDGARREEAVVAERARPEIALVPGRAPEPDDEPRGLRAADMDAEGRALLRRIVTRWIERFRPEIAARQRERVEAAGWGEVRFQWSGSTEPSEPHSYRIDGPTFVIEYANTQDGANHVHCVWRDRERELALADDGG